MEMKKIYDSKISKFLEDQHINESINLTQKTNHKEKSMDDKTEGLDIKDIGSMSEMISKITYLENVEEAFSLID